MQERITELKAEGYRIIYLDECLITTKALLMSDYTNLNTKHRIPMTKVSQPAYQVILAISEENGLEHCGYYTKSGDTKRFKEYINELYVANKDAKIAVLMDNLGVHKSPEVRQLMDELDIPAIYNVPYQPDFNPAEACFSKIKNYFRRKKLNLLVNEIEFDSQELVKEAVGQLTQDDIESCIRYSLHLIYR